MKIVAIGDSITYGFPYLPELSWINQAAERLQFDFVNSGLNGDTVEGMLCRFKRDVLCHKPTHVIMMGGTNDAFGGAPVFLVADAICEMCESARQNGIVPMIGVPIPCDDQREEELLQEYRQAMRSYAANQGILTLDFYAAMLDNRNMTIRRGLYCDGVHPNRRGYSVMADLAARDLAQLFAK